jgi:hypothetical protein
MMPSGEVRAHLKSAHALLMSFMVSASVGEVCGGEGHEGGERQPGDGELGDHDGCSGGGVVRSGGVHVSRVSTLKCLVK